MAYGHTLQEAIEIGLKYNHAAIMEKDGKYLSEKIWSDVKYGETLGWKYIGTPVALAKDYKI